MAARSSRHIQPQIAGYIPTHLATTATGTGAALDAAVIVQVRAGINAGASPPDIRATAGLAAGTGQAYDATAGVVGDTPTNVAAFAVPDGYQFTWTPPSASLYTHQQVEVDPAPATPSGVGVCATLPANAWVTIAGSSAFFIGRAEPCDASGNWVNTSFGVARRARVRGYNSGTDTYGPWSAYSGFATPAAFNTCTEALVRVKGGQNFDGAQVGIDASAQLSVYAGDTTITRADAQTPSTGLISNKIITSVIGLETTTGTSCLLGSALTAGNTYTSLTSDRAVTYTAGTTLWIVSKNTNVAPHIQAVTVAAPGVTAGTAIPVTSFVADTTGPVGTFVTDYLVRFQNCLFMPGVTIDRLNNTSGLESLAHINITSGSAIGKGAIWFDRCQLFGGGPAGYGITSQYRGGIYTNCFVHGYQNATIWYSIGGGINPTYVADTYASEVCLKSHNTEIAAFSHRDVFQISDNTTTGTAAVVFTRVTGINNSDSNSSWWNTPGGNGDSFNGIHWESCWSAGGVGFTIGNPAATYTDCSVSGLRPLRWPYGYFIITATQGNNVNLTAPQTNITWSGSLYWEPNPTVPRGVPA